MALRSDHEVSRSHEALSLARLGFAIRLGLAKVGLQRRRERAARRSLHPASTLPPDVLIACFELLDFDDRLRASHVSRYWRRVALDTPLLWSTFAIGTFEKEGIDKLDAMLRRTQTVALSVTLRFSPLDVDTGALLGAHFARLRLLRSHDPPGRLDAPPLETLEILRFRSPGLVLSEDYVGASARSLRTLQLRLFSIGPTCPVFVSLREFRAVFTPETDVARLLELCPALVALTVWCDITLAVDPEPLFVTLPPGLTDITISGLLLWFDRSYHSLRQWLGHRFRRLELSRVQDISSVLHLFGPSLDAQPDENWSMQVLIEDNGALVADKGVITMSTTMDSARAVVPAFPRSAAFEAIWGLHDCAHIVRLKELRLAPLFFDVFVEDGVALPGLLSLTVVSDEERGDELPAACLRPGSGIRAPMLRYFALACMPGQAFRRDAVQWFFSALPTHLRQWVLYDTEKIETVALVGIIPKTARRRLGRRRSPIYLLAREIHISTK